MSQEPRTVRLPLRLVALPVLCLALGCGARFPAAQALPEGRADAARALLDAAIEAQGGYLFDEAAAVEVHYDGRWYRTVKLLQPVLVDAGYRGSSVERLTTDDGRLRQEYTGPKGTKTVVRRADAVEVRYDGEIESRDKQRAAAALVADAYTMFLTGPSFFRHRNAQLSLLEPESRDGSDYRRIVARLSPGFGFSELDTVILWIEAETSRLDRVHFTIDGLESTRGAHVDVAFDNHRWIDGYRWPTHFMERVRGPVKVKAHRWELTHLAVRPAVVKAPEPAAAR